MDAVARLIATNNKQKSGISSIKMDDTIDNNKIRQKLSRQSIDKNKSSKYKNKDKNKFEEEKDKEDKEYDSENSIDQLLDDNFIPYQSQPNHMKSCKLNNKYNSPKKYIKKNKKIITRTGSKRAKIMAMIASNKKKKKILSKRKILTPNILNNEYNEFNNKYNDNLLIITPKKKKNKLKNMETPLTPTPVKLIRNLNVKTPNKTSINNDDKLILISKKLPLPIKYSILFEKFNALESTLALLMRKNTFFVHYEKIENSVKTICKKKFLSKDLQQILTIVPDFYHIQWTLNLNKLTNKKELKLTISAIDYDPYNIDIDKKQINKLNEIGTKFLKISKLKEREKIFRLRLIKYIKNYHQKWLKDNIMIEFDPFQTRKWHKRFDLENINDIKLYSLPLKPTKDIDQIEKMIIKQKEFKNDKINKIDKNVKNEKIPNHLKHLSPTLIAKIRAKKEINKMNKINKINDDKMNDDKLIKNEIEQLPYLINLIRGIFISSKKSSMACNDLINLIKKRHRNQYILNQEIWKQLQILNKLKSTFFKIKQGSIIKIAKLNKKIPTKDVLDEINKTLK